MENIIFGESNKQLTFFAYSHVLPTMQEEVARKLNENY